MLCALAAVLALMVLLVLIAAIGLGPDDSGPLGPVPKPPQFDAAVGSSVALTPSQVAQVAPGVVAPGGGPVGRPRSAAPASAPDQRGGGNGGEGPAVAPGRAVAVAVATPAPESAPAPAAQPVAAPAPEPASAPALAPPAAPGPATPGGGTGGQGGPITAGTPSLESCEGDQYLITIALAPEAAEEGDESVEIVLSRIGEDGSVEELRLEGDLLDARNLALKLSSEGNCVHIEAGELEFEAGEPESPAGDSEPEVAPEPDAP